MKILYVTDLHGNEWRYEKTLQVALREKVSIVVNGGDMLPYEEQGEFLWHYLPDYFERFHKTKIPYLCMLSNDDLSMYDEDFDGLCQRCGAQNIAQRNVEVLGYEFIGMNCVRDYPFRLKDRCRLDASRDHIIKRQFGTALFSVYKGTKALDSEDLINPFDSDLSRALATVPISDITTQTAYDSYLKKFALTAQVAYSDYLKSLPTIEQELNKLPTPSDMSKCIYVIHEPPYGVGLDVVPAATYDSKLGYYVVRGKRNSKIGSRSVHDFIKRRQPAFSLHGHIHESPLISKKWFAKIGKTVCIQPGQLPLQKMPKGLQEYFTTYVLIDLDSGVIRRVDEPLCKGGADAFCF